MSRRNQPVICIFVKEPRTGFAKTRLAPAIGFEAAAALAGAFFQDTLALATSRAWARTVIALDGDSARLGGVPEGIEVWPQGDGDLGARLERAVRRALDQAPYAIAVGSDSPDLPERLLDDAGIALEESDAVVGPAHDGGFYLLGLSRCPEGLLANLPWSARDTLERSVSRLQERKFSVELLEPWHDVDIADDLDRLRARLRSGRVTAEATAALLRLSGDAGA